jgi:acetyltransferase-like isoleucine patch superfamily enzyme
MASPYIHPTAIVETHLIGEDTRIWAFTHVMGGVVIGARCNVGDHCFLESGAVVGDNVTIKNGNMLFEGITLEDGVFVGPHVFFTNDLYPRSPRLPQAQLRYSDHAWLKPTLVKRGASLGAGAVVLAGVTIGEYSMVGAGAVITRSTLPYSLMLGNPARRRGWVCQCGLKLEFTGSSARCSGCGRVYANRGDVVQLEMDCSSPSR